MIKKVMKNMTNALGIGNGIHSFVIYLSASNLVIISSIAKSTGA